MVKRVILFIILLVPAVLFAKKVKFSVDMTGQTISPNGVHISGDFQTEAGFPADWDSKATLLTREGLTNIYSVEVIIPAFRKYEYKFVNGDQFYEVEFVPEKSRVGFDFSDNRWIYVDSVNSEIHNFPILPFGGNAPVGKKMIRFKLDLSLQNTNHKNGVHVASNFNNWNPSLSHMVSFDGKVFESIEYTDSLKVEYVFVNGNLYEQVNVACSNQNKNRFINLASDTVLNEVCFNECTDCVVSNSPIGLPQSMATLYPNPSSEVAYLTLAEGVLNQSVLMFDISGRQIMIFKNLMTPTLAIPTFHLQKGMYYLKVTNAKNAFQTLKLIVN
jgi:hypothetical protein